MHALRPVADAVAHALQRPGAGREEVQAAKAKAARELGIPVPPDRDVLTLLDAPLRERHASVLRSKPQRSASGVAIVAVMTSPAACPHGKCTFCPGGPEVGVPQSYTGFEPSTMRAAQLAYDPYRIVRTRLAQLERNGHAVDKVDVILQGGTFPAREPAYQSWCVAMVLAGLRDGPGADGEAGEAPVAERAWAALEDAEQRRRLALALQDNEGAPCRMVGLTVETKPDWCLEPHVDRMLEQGVTRVEVGLQTLDEATLQATHRGHTLAESRRCLQVARDAGLKVCVHMMPGLPRDRAAGTVGAWGGDLDPDPEADLDEMRRLFTEPAWRPDMLKVYPCLVVQEGETLLKRQWREGRFHPLGAQDAAALVGRMKDHVPEWCRIQRVDRDIPTTHVEAGVLQSNLRQMAQAWRARQGLPPCRCIRCREAGRREAPPAPSVARATLRRVDYEASDGLECFLALEDPEADAVFAFLRLRRPGPNAHRPEAQAPGGVAFVRELKVFGTALGVGDDPDGGSFQHQGLGARLLREAESIAFGAWRVGRVLVTAGAGVKPYYRRHGYEDLGPYVAKAAPPR